MLAEEPTHLGGSLSQGALDLSRVDPADRAPVVESGDLARDLRTACLALLQCPGKRCDDGSVRPVAGSNPFVFGRTKCLPTAKELAEPSKRPTRL